MSLSLFLGPASSLAQSKPPPITLVLKPSEPPADVVKSVLNPPPEKKWDVYLIEQQVREKSRLEAEEAARKAAEAKAVLEAQEAARVAQAARERLTTQTSYAPVSSSGGQLIAGTYGYTLASGNCINEPGVNNPGWGSPYQWPATSSEPWIGATVLFTWNHTGVVTGLWSTGDVEIRHQNAGGMTHRIPRWMIRGYR